MIVYLFDLKTPNAREYNTLKRRFYYQLKHTVPNEFEWKTKSVLVVSDKIEKNMDVFFKRWKGRILLYKIKTKRITHIF